MERKQPILVIEIRKMDDQSAEIKFSGSSGFNERTIHADFGHGTLSEHFKRYNEALINFKRGLDKTIGQDPQKLTEAFQKLSNQTNYLYLELFRNDKQAYIDIKNHLENHVLKTDYLKPGAEIKVIEIMADSIKHLIPIECLVIPDSKLEVKEIKDVGKSASRILGFSFIIDRRVPKTKYGARVLNNIPRLPLKLFYDASLTGAKKECDFFGSQKYFNLDGPWPDKDDRASVEDVVRYFYRPDIRFERTGKVEKIGHQHDEIHHLSCHCSTNENESWKSYFRLTNIKVSLGEMQGHLVNLFNGESLKQERPLIFLNACEGSSLSPKGMTSFPQYFLNDNENCGFIGCEIDIPDRFAAEFSEKFYLYLMGGCGVGEALFRARRAMLERYNNPLGLLYTFYGDPYLRVAEAVKDV